MGRLVLIRHAQASFLAADYDQLSELGREQARRLGEYWARGNVAFDRLWTGPRARHKDTARITLQWYRRDLPNPVEMDEFDEYDGESVLKRAVPQLAEQDLSVRQLHEAFLASADAPGRREAFQRLFECVISKWVEGEIVIPAVESWSEFCSRVNEGISKVLAQAESGEQIGVFSSGGPVAVAMQRALNLSARDTLRTSWMSRNCSYSEFLFSADRFTLSAFNAFPHLDSAQLLTYR